jgi:hypothetical protein
MTAMVSHFTEEVLRKNLDDLANRQASSSLANTAGRPICAEARFETDHTVQRMAYLAHLQRHSTD